MIFAKQYVVVGRQCYRWIGCWWLPIWCQ